MTSIHGHEVLNMMLESGERYSQESLEAAISARFGKDARPHYRILLNLPCRE